MARMGSALCYALVTVGGVNLPIRSQLAVQPFGHHRAVIVGPVVGAALPVSMHGGRGHAPARATARMLFFMRSTVPPRTNLFHAFNCTGSNG